MLAPRHPITLVNGALARMRAAALAVLLIALAGASVMAQGNDAGEVTPATVVATVGGEEITEADVAFIAEDLQQELQQIPPADRKAFLVARLVERKVMAKAARDAQMQDTDLFRQRLGYLEDRALQRAYFVEEIAAKITPESVEAAYAEFVAGFQPEDEARARHILVATREDAEAVIAELEGGKPFEVLAMEKSIDPSAAQNGGDLGFFQRGRMVAPFEDAAFALEPGQLSEPVETQFGWHVIRLDEVRQSAPPPFEQIEAQLQQQVLFQAFDETVGRLSEGVEVAVVDSELAEGVARELSSEDIEESGDNEAQ